MIEKQLKVHSASKEEPQSSKARAEDRFAASVMFRTPDVATLIANQRQALEAVTAATETLLAGATEISRKQLALQNTLVQYAFRNALGVLQPSTEADVSPEVTTETALKAMQDIATTALRCNADAIAVFSDRIRRMEASLSSERGRRTEAAD
jgi:hypothetical protein